MTHASLRCVNQFKFSLNSVDNNPRDASQARAKQVRFCEFCAFCVRQETAMQENIHGNLRGNLWTFMFKTRKYLGNNIDVVQSIVCHVEQSETSRKVRANERNVNLFTISLRVQPNKMA